MFLVNLKQFLKKQEVLRSKVNLKIIVVYAVAIALLIVLLNFLEYFFWVRMHLFEAYATIVGLSTLAIGVFLGKKLRQPTPPKHENSTINAKQSLEMAISKRELEVLLMLGQGKSNKEIAEALFVSTNTIKTHISSLFEKLDVKNRTQAIIVAKNQGILL